MYQNYNANPISRRGDDCVVRAISKVMGKSWQEVYSDLCLYGLVMYDMPSSNLLWGQYLTDNGYQRHPIQFKRYTVSEFANDHRKGRYILALDGHIVACIDGIYFDTWDSGDEIPLYYWQKEE